MLKWLSPRVESRDFIVSWTSNIFVSSSSTNTYPTATTHLRQPQRDKHEHEGVEGRGRGRDKVERPGVQVRLQIFI